MHIIVYFMEHSYTLSILSLLVDISVHHCVYLVVGSECVDVLILTNQLQLREIETY